MYNIILMEELATGRRYVLVLTGRVRGWEGQEGKGGDNLFSWPPATGCSVGTKT